VISSKLEILQLENYDNISHFSNSNHLQGYDSFICALGSRVGRGQEEFEKVDYTYVTDSAVMAINAGIPHFSVVSTVGADPDSWFLYLRTKGLADEYLKNLKMPY
jgi:oxidoreductase